MKCSHPANGLRIAMEQHRDHLEGTQLVSVHRKPSASSMVRTRGSSAAGSKDDNSGNSTEEEDDRNKNAGAESLSEQHGGQSRVSFYGVASMPVYYREGTPPPDQEEEYQQHGSSSSALHLSHNFHQQQQQHREFLGAAEGQRQPPSPMVTPPGFNAEAVRHTKKLPPAGAGVPHIYHDYSQVPDESNYVRKKTGGVCEFN